MYKEKCLIPVSPLPDSAGLAFLGDTFIRNYYTSFDFDKQTVTFAPNAAHEFGATLNRDESFLFFIFAILFIFLFAGCCIMIQKYKLKKQNKKAEIAALVAESDPLNVKSGSDSEEEASADSEKR